MRRVFLRDFLPRVPKTLGLFRPSSSKAVCEERSGHKVLQYVFFMMLLPNVTGGSSQGFFNAGLPDHGPAELPNVGLKHARSEKKARVVGVISNQQA